MIKVGLRLELACFWSLCQRLRSHFLGTAKLSVSKGVFRNRQRVDLTHVSWQLSFSLLCNILVFVQVFLFILESSSRWPSWRPLVLLHELKLAVIRKPVLDYHQCVVLAHCDSTLIDSLVIPGTLFNWIVELIPEDPLNSSIEREQRCIIHQLFNVWNSVDFQVLDQSLVKLDRDFINAGLVWIDTAIVDRFLCLGLGLDQTN